MSRRTATLLSAAFAVVVGVAVLAGWLFGVEGLIAPIIPEPGIKANTAAGLVLIGAALWLATFDQPRAPKRAIVVLSALVLVVGLATVVEYAAAIDLGIDNLLFRDYHPRSPLNPFPGRMAFGSAASFALLGGAMLARHGSSGRWWRAGDLGAAGAVVVTLLGLVSYVYRVPPSEPLSMVAYRVAPATGLALLAVASAVLASGEAPWLMALLGSGGSVASIARRLLPAVVLAPVAIGLIVQRLEHAGLVGGEFGDALVAVGAGVSLGLAVVWSAASAMRLDVARGDALAQAAASDYQYRIAVEAAPAGMLLVDAEGKVTLANRRVTDMFGYEIGELVGRPVEILLPEVLRSRHVGDRAGFAEGPLAHREIGVGKEFRGLRKDGTEIPVEIGLSPIAIGDSRMVLAAVVDITSRKVLEDQLRQAQKMEAVGRLAGGVAHDFNNILTAILGHADFLEEEIGPGARGTEELDGIKVAARRAADLTHQLLAFSRQQVLEPKVFPLSDVVVKSERMLQRIIGEDIELVTVVAPDTGSVRADPSQVGQVLLNLVVNARDAMPRGGRLTIETGAVELDASVPSAHGDVRPGRYAMLAVTDTGAGMDRATQARLFEPFFTTKGVGEGTGLGLAMVYGVVKQSGGHIWVYSEPGKGSVFKVHLPAVAQTEQGAAAASPALVARGGTETVLVVEDDLAVRAIAVGALRRRGYRVLEAAAPDEALQLVQTEAGGAIHALVTDVVMRGMGGLELARTLRRRSPDTRILFTSGYTAEAAALQSVIDSGLAFLQKPFTVEGLGRKVREVLDAPPGVLPDA